MEVFSWGSVYPYNCNRALIGHQRPMVCVGLESLSDFADDLRQKSHSQGDAHGDDEHRPQVVDYGACLSEQTGEV
jgi:hypothetical protein